MDVKDAHKFSIHHRRQIERSSLCGCFYCLATYPPSHIEEWTDDDDTALCPRCGIDSVLGSDSGVPLDKEFLTEMKAYWFR